MSEKGNHVRISRRPLWAACLAVGIAVPTVAVVGANAAAADNTAGLTATVQIGQVTNNALTVRFKVTDTARTIPVVYTGILPDLFREGKGVIAQGRVGADGIFHATEILAKHDENYMPPAAADAVKQAQQKKGGT